MTGWSSMEWDRETAPRDSAPWPPEEDGIPVLTIFRVSTCSAAHAKKLRSDFGLAAFDSR